MTKFICHSMKLQNITFFVHNGWRFHDMSITLLTSIFALLFANWISIIISYVLLRLKILESVVILWIQTLNFLVLKCGWFEKHTITIKFFFFFFYFRWSKWTLSSCKRSIKGDSELLESKSNLTNYKVTKIIQNNSTFSWFFYNNLIYWLTVNNLNFMRYLLRVIGWSAIAKFNFFKKKIN